jgi:hypothetical protein
LDTGTAWADDRHFSLEKDKFRWPEGETLRYLTKQHWDKNLNAQYTCPTLADGYKSQLFGEDTSKQKCGKVQPQGKNWVYWETGSFFLFQDQCLRGSHPAPGPTCIQDAEVYHNTVSVATLKATGQAKEFTVMSGNMNEKVQMLQVCSPDILVDLLICLRTHILIVCATRGRVVVRVLHCDGQHTWCSALLSTDRRQMLRALCIHLDPLDSEQPIEYLKPEGHFLAGPDGNPGSYSTIKVFWLARDRIFPSEW